LCDFYRGKLSARRIRVLLRFLPHDAALTRALNDGQPGWSPTDHLLADLWVLVMKVAVALGILRGVDDHPVRAKMQEKARLAEKLARVAELKATFAKRKNTYLRRVV
jgi:hypothetical protein